MSQTDRNPAPASTAALHPMGPDSYLRQMGLSFRTDDGAATGTLPFSPALWSNDGRPRLSALGALADCVAGYRAVRDFDGAWLGTSELAVHGPFRAADADVDATAELLRRRRSGAVYEVVFHSGKSGTPLAEATVTLALLSRQGERKLPTTAGRRPSAPCRPLTTIGELVTLEEDDEAALTRLEVTDTIRNSWGVVAGGMVTLLCECEAERAATAGAGRAQRVEGLGMHFLAPGRAGPLAARATLLSDPTATGMRYLRVRVVDQGADGRLLATASATVAPLTPGAH